MKTAKVIGVILLVLLLIVGGGLYYLFSNLDSLVKKGIETYGSQAAGTAVRVDSVDLKLRQASGTINGLTIANPAGFSAKPMFSLGRIHLKLDADSLSGKTPTIDQLAITAPRLLFEVDDQGRSNLQVLKRHLARNAPGTQEKPADQGQKSEERLRVKRLTISDATAAIDLTAMGGKTYQGTLPEIVLTDIGGPGGTTPAALARVVLDALGRELEREAARRGANAVLHEKLDKATEKLQRKLDEKMGEGAGKTLRNLLGQ